MDSDAPAIVRGNMGYMVPVIVAAKRRRIEQAFSDAGATGVGGARQLEELGVEDSVVFRSMCSQGVIRATGGNRYWLDLAQADQAHADRRSRARKLLVLMAAIVLLIFLLWR